MSQVVHLAFVPRDGIFCKDGRGWFTSDSGRGHSLDWPWPSTVLGALRTAWGRRAEEKVDQAFGPEQWRTKTAAVRLGTLLALRRPHGEPWGAVNRIWSAPSDALRLEDHPTMHRLSPVPSQLPTRGRDDDEARESLWMPMLDDASKPVRTPRWWTEARFVAWLAGGTIPAEDPESAFDGRRRVQTHVGILPDTLTAKEDVLYSHDVVETLDDHAEWGIGLEAFLPETELPRCATLGSDSRLARIESIPSDVFSPPHELQEAFREGSTGLRLVVTTPACFDRGWLPDGFKPVNGEFHGTLPGVDGDCVLRSANVPRPVHISGWDMAANEPKKVARMVAPGAVYFFERAVPFMPAEAAALWLAAVGSRTDEGFGRVVPGIWDPTRRDR